MKIQREQHHPKLHMPLSLSMLSNTQLRQTISLGSLFHHTPLPEDKTRAGGRRGGAGGRKLGHTNLSGRGAD